MNVFESLDTQHEKSIYTFMDVNSNTYYMRLSKSFLQPTQVEQYFLKLYTLSQNKMLCTGYIYFYVNLDKKESSFIGEFVKPEYRFYGLGNLLLSSWIKLCLDENLNILTTNKKQRKPFLLYLLKTFYFEISDYTLYEKSFHTIWICKNMLDLNQKCLFFKSPLQSIQFQQSKIKCTDNYVILNSNYANKSLDELKQMQEEPPHFPYIEILNQVLLSRKYNLEDKEAAYQKVLEIHRKFKK